MRWLWITLLLASILIACNTSNGSSCSSAGGVCILSSCSAYCLNGTCFTPLPQSAQDCPSSFTNSAGVTNTGNPCCVSPPESTDSGTPVPPTDAGETTDATVGADADATVVTDSSVVTDGSHEGGSEADTGPLTCVPVNEGGSDGAGMCPLDGGDEDSGTSDAPSDG
jgi:hypothetical protein